MPPIWALTRCMEGKVGLSTCVVCLTTLTVLATFVAVYHPLIAIIIAFLVESVCAAYARGGGRVYARPYLAQSFENVSRFLDVVVPVAFYARHAGPATTALAALTLSVMELRGREDYSVDYIVACGLVVAMLFCEIYLAGLSLFLTISILSLVVAAGFASATLIYREAAGSV